MTSAKPKTKETTKMRQARDKREYQRLVAEIKSHLEHKSPGLWGFIEDTAKVVKDSVTNAWDKVTSWAGDTSKKIDERTGGAWETASAPIIEAGYKAGEAIDKGITAVGEWGKSAADEAAGFYDTAVDKVKDYLGEVVDRTKDYIDEGGGAVDDAWRKLVDDVEDNLGGAGETIRNTFTTITEKLGDIITKVDITLGVGMEAAWAALGGLPDLLTTFKTDLSNWFTFSMTEFNETMAKLREGMKLPETPEHPAEWRK